MVESLRGSSLLVLLTFLALAASGCGAGGADAPVGDAGRCGVDDHAPGCVADGGDAGTDARDAPGDVTADRSDDGASADAADSGDAMLDAAADATADSAEDAGDAVDAAPDAVSDASTIGDSGAGDAGAPVAPGHNASGLASGGTVMRGARHTLVVTVGESSPAPWTMRSSSGYRLQGGIVGASGTLP